MTRRSIGILSALVVAIGLFFLLAYLGGERPLERMETPVNQEALVK